MLIYYSTSINLLIFAGERRQSVTRPKHDILDIEYVVDQVNRMRGEVSIGMCLGVGKMTVIIPWLDATKSLFWGSACSKPTRLDITDLYCLKIESYTDVTRM